MIDELKRIINWHNCTITKLHGLIKQYQKLALSNCHEDLEYDVIRSFEFCYKQANLKMSTFFKNYCSIILAKLSSDIVKNSKNYSRVGIEIAKDLLLQYANMYFVVSQKDEVFLDDYVEKIFLLDIKTDNCNKTEKDLINLYKYTRKIMNNDCDNNINDSNNDLTQKQCECYNWLMDGDLTEHQQNAKLVKRLAQRH